MNIIKIILYILILMSLSSANKLNSIYFQLPQGKSLYSINYERDLLLLEKNFNIGIMIGFGDPVMYDKIYMDNNDSFVVFEGKGTLDETNYHVIQEVNCFKLSKGLKHRFESAIGIGFTITIYDKLYVDISKALYEIGYRFQSEGGFIIRSGLTSFYLYGSNDEFFIPSPYIGIGWSF